MKLIYINLIVLSTVFFLNYYFRFKISYLLKIQDKPDRKKKLHLNIVPLNGGVWFSAFLIILIFEYILFKNLISNDLAVIIFTSFIMFMVGFIDDRKPLNPNLRLIIYFLIFFFFCEFNNNLKINIIFFESIEFKIQTSFLSSIISAFCLTAFVNSINLIDGINSLANSYLTIMLIFLFIIFPVSQAIIIPLIIFLIFNSIFIYKGRYFLGDSGSIGISTFIGMYVIYIYNINLSEYNILLHAEDIFILMAFPGLDMIRVFVSRILNKENPFKGGRNHLHHYLINKHKLHITLLLYITFAFFPSFSNFILKNYASWNFLFCLILYITLLKYATHDKINKV